MTTRMLIDARHQEETRVAVLKGNRIEEFDFESADHKQIKGNIYLAKVTRVEPSLQAAFVDFGGNRHGFLAFSEIHPDYYQIPKEDREALLAEEAEHAAEEAALRAAEEAEEEAAEFADENGDTFADELAGDEGVTEVDTSEKDQVATIEGGLVDNGFDNGDEEDREEGEEAETSEAGDEGERRPRRGRRQGRSRAKQADELRDKRMALRRRYKIQDVIQRRQVLLVQVVKEERGNKGAALTTYLSLAGRYCVLMPNSSHGGGISRKINSAADRKRLKSIISELDLPKSMSCIVRTAGLQRTKPEIKRDFDYLARLWDEIREQTLKSSAPALIHSDSDLIKRAIRDIYNRDIEEVVVEGDTGYRAAKDFMKLLMPSHAKRVKQYADPVPLFQRYGAEDQLTAMYDPVVQLKSGGYLVINPTEALVSIDINSGRSTKEHGIEATAVSTNLEAAREIARQLRLRDMAGLVVIDFIDMEYGSNIRKVEKAMKDALKNDRARIQVGRISGFGLMEMSRQRLRTGVLEATTRACPHCDGSGLVRTASSAGLSALRMIEDEAAKGKGSIITLFASQEAAIYVLNAKRGDLQEIEDRYGVKVEVIPEGENEGAKMRVASRGPRPEFVPRFAPILEPVVEDEIEDDYEDEIEEEARDRRESRDGDGDGEGGRRKRRKRRRGRNRDRGDEEQTTSADEEAGDEETTESKEAFEGEESSDNNGEGGGRRKRRRRGRRRRGGLREDGSEQIADGEPEGEAIADTAEPVAIEAMVAEETVAAEPVAEEEAVPAPKKRRTRKKVTPEAEPVALAEEAQAEPATDAAEQPVEAPAKPKRTRTRKAAVKAEPEASAPEDPAVEVAAAEPAEAKPKAKRTRAKKAAATADVAAGGTEPPAPAPSEAKSEPEVAQSAAESANEAPADEDKSPPRRGWWQRTFGE